MPLYKDLLSIKKRKSL